MSSASFIITLSMIEKSGLMGSLPTPGPTHSSTFYTDIFEKYLNHKDIMIENSEALLDTDRIEGDEVSNPELRLDPTEPALELAQLLLRSYEYPFVHVEWEETGEIANLIWNELKLPVTDYAFFEFGNNCFVAFKDRDTAILTKLSV